MKLLNSDKLLLANNVLTDLVTIFLAISGSSLLIDSIPFESIEL